MEACILSEMFFRLTKWNAKADGGGVVPGVNVAVMPLLIQNFGQEPEVRYDLIH